MVWTDNACLRVARTMEGAIWWGAFSAIDQWLVAHRPGKPRSIRPTDKELVAAARSGPLNGDLLQRFAQEYQVFRYPLNQIAHRDARLNANGRVLFDVYHSKRDPGPEDLARMWWRAISEVREAMVCFGRTANLKSFCMKTLWIHQPVRATMWDSFAVRSLNEILKTRHNNISNVDDTARFLKDFEMLFEREHDRILTTLKVARATLFIEYKYPRRVLDKALWLLGNENDSDLAKQMKLILAADPSIRAATEHRFPELATDPGR
jgi:hypothetical protein